MLYLTSLDQHVKIPMRDGVELDAAVWRPLEGGRYPVILERVDYDLLARCSRLGDHFAQHGYVFIGQNLRGTYSSDGQYGGWLSNARQEADDGYDTVEWAARQPWSSGLVGMVDGSASGFTQYVLAPQAPPHLSALFIREAPADIYRAVFRGGAFQMTWLIAVLSHVHDDLLQGKAAIGQEGKRAELSRALEVSDAWLRHLPLRSCPPLEDIPQAQFYFDWLAHPNDGPFWRPLDLGGRYREVDLPITHAGGWFDIFLDSTLRSFRGIQTSGRTERCRTSQRLIVGPWIHGPLATLSSRAGELDFGPQAILDLDAHRLRWYDHWLKGEKSNSMAELPVRIFLMGENRWLSLTTWPPDNLIQTPFYLREGTELRGGSLNEGALSPTPPERGEHPDQYVYDPDDPIPSLVSYPDFGPRDYRALEERMLTYTSAPLEEDVVVIGPVQAILYAASSTPDTDWVVRLCDVCPDGRSLSVCDGILRARYRASPAEPESMAPGTVYRFAVDLWATAQTFRAGHRLRVEVTSSDFPRYDRNLNTGGPLGEETTGQVAYNAIFHDADRPSHLLLPLYIPDRAPR